MIFFVCFVSRKRTRPVILSLIQFRYDALIANKPAIRRLLRHGGRGYQKSEMSQQKIENLKLTSIYFQVYSSLLFLYIACVSITPVMKIFQVCSCMKKFHTAVLNAPDVPFIRSQKKTTSVKKTH